MLYFLRKTFLRKKYCYCNNLAHNNIINNTLYGLSLYNAIDIHVYVMCLNNKYQSSKESQVLYCRENNCIRNQTFDPKTNSDECSAKFIKMWKRNFKSSMHIWFAQKFAAGITGRTHTYIHTT